MEAADLTCFGDDSAITVHVARASCIAGHLNKNVATLSPAFAPSSTTGRDRIT